MADPISSIAKLVTEILHLADRPDDVDRAHYVMHLGRARARLLRSLGHINKKKNPGGYAAHEALLASIDRAEAKIEVSPSPPTPPADPA